jgi:hypothetical protein
VQHDPLIGRRQPFRLAQVQRSAGVVEDRQIVVGVGGQADHVAHRDQGAPGGDGVPGPGFEFGQGGGHDDGDRQPAVGAQGGIPELAAQQCAERVVVALRGAAGVLFGALRAGFAVHAGRLVAGVAHAGRGELGQPRFY